MRDPGPLLWLACVLVSGALAVVTCLLVGRSRGANKNKYSSN
jgi:hypothetical protein